MNAIIFEFLVTPRLGHRSPELFQLNRLIVLRILHISASFVCMFSSFSRGIIVKMTSHLESVSMNRTFNTNAHSGRIRQLPDY